MPLAGEIKKTKNDCRATCKVQVLKRHVPLAQRMHNNQLKFKNKQTALQCDQRSSNSHNKENT